MKVCILVHSYCKLSCRELSRIVMLTAYQELSGIVITSTLLVVVLGWRWNSCSPRFVLLLSFVHQFWLLSICISFLVVLSVCDVCMCVGVGVTCLVFV